MDSAWLAAGLMSIGSPRVFVVLFEAFEHPTLSTMFTACKKAGGLSSGVLLIHALKVRVTHYDILLAEGSRGVASD